MKSLKMYWNGFTNGARLAVVFTAFMAVMLLYAMLAGELQSTTQPLVVVSNEVAQQSQFSKDSMDLCEGVVIGLATNRSSVKFTSPLPLQRVRLMGDGQLEVYTKFSAKNGFGSESVSLAKCIVSGDGKSLIEFTVEDVR